MNLISMVPNDRPKEKLKGLRKLKLDTSSSLVSTQRIFIQHFSRGPEHDQDNEVTVLVGHPRAP